VLAGSAAGLVRPPSADAAACSETVQQIVDIAAIAEALAVTTYWHGIIEPAVFGHLTDQRPYLQGALSAEYSHFQTLKGAGAAEPQWTFHFAPGTFGSVRAFGETVVALENAFTSAYGAAVNRFCVLNQPALAQLSARILGVEAEHRFAARDLLGDVLPNNLILEPALFTCVGDAATALTPFLNGSGGHTVAKGRPTQSQITKSVGKYAGH
jgi:Ferritin-like domain